MTRRVVIVAAAVAAAGCAGGSRPGGAPSSGARAEGAPPAPERAAPTPSAPSGAPTTNYLVYVVSESVDKLAVVRFGPGDAEHPGPRAVVEREVAVGIMPADVDGPHGVTVSPDGRYYYVTTAHGTPRGSLWKYAADGDSLVGRVELGNFPATAQATPDGAFVYAVNFNLHGDMVPSSVSVVATDAMTEVARITTCTMPHGSRINPQGTRHYSACMMDDMLIEIDTRTFAVARHFMLTKGREHGMAGAPRHAAHGGHGALGKARPVIVADGRAPAPWAADATCSPTWAQPSHDGARVYVACNKSNEVVEIDVARWQVTRRLPAGDGVYNLAATRDGRLLVATNKRGRSVSVFDLARGNEVARIPTRRRVVHGVVVSPDDRYAFISVEGVGSEPGTVEVVDLRALASVASVDVGQQAGGIDFWRTESARR